MTLFFHIRVTIGIYTKNSIEKTLTLLHSCRDFLSPKAGSNVCLELASTACPSTPRLHNSPLSYKISLSVPSAFFGGVRVYISHNIVHISSIIIRSVTSTHHHETHYAIYQPQSPYSIVFRPPPRRNYNNMTPVLVVPTDVVIVVFMVTTLMILSSSIIWPSADAWMTPSYNQKRYGQKMWKHHHQQQKNLPILSIDHDHIFRTLFTTTTTTSTTTTTTLWMAPQQQLPEGYQDYGERVIREVASTLCGMEYGTNDDADETTISIEWKPGRIIVTVHGDAAFLSRADEEEEEEEEVYDADIDDDEFEIDDDVLFMDSDEDEDDFLDDIDKDDDEEDVGDGILDDDIVDDVDNNDKAGDDVDDGGVDNLITMSSVEGEEAGSQRRGKIDIAQLARAINAAFNDDGIGLAIAESHEIEVTTPGITDELVGDVMFQAYRGFEVICQQVDPKTQKVKTIEGRLVERNDEFTILNIKGRTKKMKNGTVLSVKLPKAKKEKGGG